MVDVEVRATRMWLRRGRCLAFVFAVSLLCRQPGTLAQSLPLVETPTAAVPSPTVEVPLAAREVPRTAMRGFVAACERGDFDEAATYLNLRRAPKALSKTPARLLARQLSVVLDRKLAIDLETLNDTPEGDQQDNLPRGIDSLGEITTNTGNVPILIERVRDDGNLVWAIAATTVAQIPRLDAEFGYGPLGDLLAPIFFELRFLGIQLWQWLGLLAIVTFSWLISRLIAVLVLKLGKALAKRTSTPFDDALVQNAAGPLRLILAALLLATASEGLILAARPMAAINGGVRWLVIIGITWLVVRLADVFASMLVARRHPTAAFMPLGRRTVKALALAIATISTLQTMGFDVSSLLAGLGIGGLAIALASQKTVEHLFGGITLVADQPVRVGELCKFGDKTGVVEDIGLRSTRIRTADRTVVSIPNGEFSAMQIENLSRRDRIRLKTVLGLRYETGADQLRYLIAEIKSLLLACAKVDGPSVEVSFVQFGASSLDIEISAYIRTTNAEEFSQVREELFLRIMDLVAEAGSGFAFPSQTLYLGSDHGLDENKREILKARLIQRSTDGDA